MSNKMNRKQNILFDYLDSIAWNAIFGQIFFFFLCSSPCLVVLFCIESYISNVCNQARKWLNDLRCQIKKTTQTDVKLVHFVRCISSIRNIWLCEHQNRYEHWIDCTKVISKWVVFGWQSEIVRIVSRTKWRDWGYIKSIWMKEIERERETEREKKAWRELCVWFPCVMSTVRSAFFFFISLFPSSPLSSSSVKLNISAWKKKTKKCVQKCAHI